MTPSAAQSPLVSYLIAAVTTVVGLLATQGLITNGWERTISGVAAVVIPVVYMAVNAWHAHSDAKVRAAVLTNGAAGGGGQ